MGQYVIDSSTWDCVWDEVSFPLLVSCPPPFLRAHSLSAYRKEKRSQDCL